MSKILEINLSDVKVGDEVFDSATGYKEVTHIETGDYPISVGEDIYTINGLLLTFHTHPRLFHSLKECRDYWKSVYKAEQAEPKPYYRLVARNGVTVPDSIKNEVEKLINDGREIDFNDVVSVRLVGSLLDWAAQPEGEDYWCLISQLFTVEKVSQ